MASSWGRRRRADAREGSRPRVSSFCSPLQCHMSIHTELHTVCDQSGQVPHGCGAQQKDACCESEARVRQESRGKLAGHSRRGHPARNEKEGRNESLPQARCSAIEFGRGALSSAQRALDCARRACKNARAKSDVENLGDRSPWRSNSRRRRLRVVCLLGADGGLAARGRYCGAVHHAH